MSYIDVDYLERRIGPAVLSGTVSSQNTPSSMTGSVLSDFMEDASSWIDSFLAPYYDVPLSDPPAVLMGLCADKTYANLCIRANLTVPASVQARIEDSAGYLGEMINQKIKLPNQSTENEKDPAGHFFPSVSGSTKFQASDLRGTFF